MNPSDKIQIVRDGTTFGPYTVSDAHAYFEQGLLFEHDLSMEAGKTVADAKPLRRIFKEAKIKNRIFPAWKKQAGLIRNNHPLLLPVAYLVSRKWFADKRIVSLMAIGCTPLVLVVFNSTLIGYAGLAAYFSILWSIFFFLQFKTPQTTVKEAVILFCVTPLLASFIILVTSFIPPFPFFHKLADSGNFLFRWLGLFFAVGLVEEFCKALPVFLLVRRPGRILQPRTVMLYGMIAGLGFGIWEGVAYQITVNRGQDVDHAYFLNVLRLTSLPFIHAIWAGISSYFIGFSMLLPTFRWSMRLLALIIPATLHATHNAFPGIASVLIDLFSVLLLMTYLGNGQALFASIKKP